MTVICFQAAKQEREEYNQDIEVFNMIMDYINQNESEITKTKTVSKDFLIHVGLTAAKDRNEQLRLLELYYKRNEITKQELDFYKEQI